VTGSHVDPSRRQILGRIGLSLGALVMVGAAVAGAFSAALQLAADTRAAPQAIQVAADDGPQAPDFAGKIIGVWGDTLAVNTAAGRRTLQLHSDTVIRLTDGTSGSREDLRPGLLAAIFGASIDLLTFRADLVVLLPAP